MSLKTARGDKEKAVAHLDESIQKEIRFYWYLFKYDERLKPLFGYPPFEELVKPKS